MVGGVTGRGIPTPLKGLVYARHVSHAIHTAYAHHAPPGENTPTPETGLDYPLPRVASYHVMAGYAYINPLAGLTPSLWGWRKG